MNQTFKTISKFWFPAMFIIVSIFLYYAGFTSGNTETTQNNLVLYGIITTFVIGVVSLLFLLDIVPNPVVWILLAIFGAGSVYFGMQNVNTIKAEIKNAEEKKRVEALVIQKLKDIRTAEVGYLDAHGEYTKDWNKLKDFMKNGKVQIVKNIGNLPDSIPTSRAFELGMYKKRPEGMTDQQILDAGLFVSDTLYESALKTLFQTKKALKKRRFPLDIDKINIAPGTEGKEFLLNTDIITVSGGVETPVFECVYPIEPKNKDEEAIKVGSLTKATTNGNWKE